jgi:hypothetical protein
MVSTLKSQHAILLKVTEALEKHNRSTEASVL